jgi:hypothetical protein
VTESETSKIKILPPAFARGWTVVEQPDGTLRTFFDYEEAIDRHSFKVLAELAEERKRK